MYGGDCDAAIAKAAAAVTHVQSQSQEVGSGDGRAGLVVFRFVISRNGLLVAGGRAVETPPIFVFRMTFYVHRGSGRARVYPRRGRRAKAFTLKGRHKRFVGDSAFHTSLRGAPLLVGEQQKKWYQQILQKVQNLVPHDYIKSCTVYTVVEQYVLCVFSSYSFWTSSSLDVPAGATQEEGHTRFLIHLLSAVRALIFLARMIQPFLSLVDREVEFCVLTI